MTCFLNYWWNAILTAEQCSILQCWPPGEPFHNFNASKPVDRNVLCCTEMSIYWCLPDKPFYSFGASRSGDRRIFMQFRNVMRRILKLKKCERVRRVGPLSLSLSSLNGMEIKEVHLTLANTSQIREPQIRWISKFYVARNWRWVMSVPVMLYFVWPAIPFHLLNCLFKRNQGKKK